MRSKYVHQLQQIPHQMHHPHIGKGDVFYWANDVYFTYNGLTRLAYHVIKNEASLLCVGRKAIR